MTDPLDALNGAEPKISEPGAGSPPPFEPPKKKRGRPPGQKNKPKDAVETADGSTLELATCMAAWAACWALIVFMCKFFGFEPIYHSFTLPEDELKEDAKILAPSFAKIPGIIRLVAMLGTPLIMLDRIMKRFSRIKKEDKPTPAPTHLRDVSNDKPLGSLSSPA
jgi:hypothetical protein